MRAGAERRRFAITRLCALALPVLLLVPIVIADPAVALGPSTTTSTTPTPPASTPAAENSAASDPGTSPPPATEPTKVPDAPIGLSSVATAAGTEVRWNAPVASKFAPAPESYAVTSCGPFAFASVELGKATSAVCVGQATTVTAAVADGKTETVIPCVPTATDFCVLGVLSVAGEEQSLPTIGGSGGTAPNAVVDPVAVPGADGSSLEVSWKSGGIATQVSPIPEIREKFEVRRGEDVLARNLVDPSFVDTECGTAARCTISIVAVSPAGRSKAVDVTGVTAGLLPPTIEPVPALVDPGTGVIAGTLGHGFDDARPVSVRLVPESGAEQTGFSDVDLVSTVTDGRWSSVVGGSIASGTYRAEARQSSFVARTEPFAIAVDRPLTASIGLLTADVVPVVGLGSVAVVGDAMATPPSSKVEIVDVWGIALLASPSVSQERLAALHERALLSGARVQRTSTGVDSSGRWSYSSTADGRTSSAHVISVTQTVPGRSPVTRYAAFDVVVPKPVIASTPKTSKFLLRSSVLVPSAAAPDAPIAPKAVAGNSSIIVSWTAPAANGSPITSYTATALDPQSQGQGQGQGQVPSCTYMVPGSGTSLNACTITGLSNGSSYSITVTATNGEGTSVASATVGPVRPAGAPEAPTEVTAIAGAASATVQWTSSTESNGATITSYIVESVALPLKSCTYTVPVGSKPVLSCTVTGLTNGTADAFTVKALSPGGTSAKSLASASVKPNAVPAAPTALVATNGNGSDVNLRWTAPAAAASPVLTYTVSTVETPVKTCVSSSQIGSPPTSCTMTGLAYGASYTFRVVATNAIGNSVPSIATAALKVTSLPDAPGSVTAKAASTSATVSWSTSAANGERVISYTVSSVEFPTKTCTYPVPVTGQPLNTCPVTGLTNGTSYSFIVKATSAAGISVASAASAKVVPAAVPSAPTAVTAVGALSSAKVSWTASVANGSAVTSYTVKSVLDPTKTCTSTALVGSPAPTCTVTGLSIGSTHTFTVTATNGAGTSLASAASASTIIGTAPDAPTGIVATRGNTTVTVSWAAPAANGKPITSYTVTSVQLPIKSCTYAVPAVGNPSNTCVVTGLTNGTNYSFTVKATNILGMSVASVASAVVVPATLPLAPTLVTVVGGVASAKVSWVASAANDTAIRLYTVKAVSDPTKTCTSTALVGSAPATCTVTGLASGTSYAFTVTATNTVGNSTASAASASTYIGGVPDAPTAVAAMPGNGTATVSWTAPAANGKAITSYTVSSVQLPLKTCSYTVPGLGTPANKCVVSGLTNGTGYTFTVKATNATGTSLVSVASTIVVPTTAPVAPTAVFAVAGDGRATVSWTPPPLTAAIVTKYTVSTVQTPVKTCTSTSIITAATPSCVVSGLTNGTNYTFVVTATNVVGTSGNSLASNIVKPFVSAIPPAAVTGTPGDGQVVVSWTPTAAMTPAITSYRVTAVGDPTKTCTYTIPSSGTVLNRCAITGLTNGSSYSFTVVAINANGSSAPSIATSPVVPFGVPGTPVPVSVNVGNGSATVSWSKPATNGSAITLYTVATVELPAKTCSSSSLLGDPATECTITGLPGGVSYTFRISATNEAGPSALSAATVPVTIYDVPSSPTGLDVDPDSGVGIATWNPSSDNGVAIWYYRVDTVEDPALWCMYMMPPFGTPTNTCQIYGLVRGQDYTFTAVAVSSRGTSAVSGVTDPITVPAVAAPNNVTGVSALNARAVLNWEAPVVPDGVVVTGYVVTSDPYVAPPRGCVNTKNMTCRYTGLTNNVWYRFSVRAITAAGVGSPAVVTAVPLPEAPAAPLNVVSSRTGSRATVSWIPSFDGGGAIWGSLVKSVEDPTKTCFKLVPTDGSPYTSDCVVEGLDPAVIYTFVVSAFNSGGESPESEPSAAPTVPVAPADVVATRGRSTVDVSWTASPPTGSTPTYRAFSTSHPELFCVADPGRNCTITGLVNGTTYSDIVVTATNEVGTSGLSDPAPAVMPADVPLAPSLVTVVPGIGQIAVSWAAPIDRGDGAPVSSYVVTVVKGTYAEFAGSCATDAGTTSCVIDGLTNGNEHAVSVVAINAMGSSRPSASISVTPSTPPGIATEVHADAVGLVDGSARTVRVFWRRPQFFIGIESGTARVLALVDGRSPQQVCSLPASGAINQECEFNTGVLTMGDDVTLVVTYENAFGSSTSDPTPSFRPANVPDAPSTVSITTSGQNATVSWTNPDGNGDAVSTIRINPVGSASPACTLTRDGGGALASECTIYGLALGTPVAFSVVALNGIGSSPAAPTDSVTPAMVPDVPFNVGLSTTTSHRTIRWSAPASNGALISRYSVRAVEDPTIVCSTASLISLPETSCIISGLDPARSLTFVVTATNRIGTSSDSLPSVDYSWVAVPDAPTGVTYGNGSVSWTAPSSDNSPTSYLRNGSAITSYRVSSVEHPDETYCALSIPVEGESADTCVLSGLVGDASYRFTVIASNPIGDSVPSLAAPVMTTALPGRVTDVSVVAGDRSALLTWAAPASSGSLPVSSYRVYAGVEGMTWKLVPVCEVSADTAVAGRFSCLVTSLVWGRESQPLGNNTTYTFTIDAQNQFGWNDGAPDATAWIGPVPATAFDVSAVAGYRSVVVEWSLPVDFYDDGIPDRTATAVEDQTKSCSSPADYVTRYVRRSVCTIDGLDPARSYTFVVTASNRAGASEDSSASNVVRPTGEPDAPSDVTASVAGFDSSSATTSMLVNWTASNPNGFPIEAYSVAADGGSTQTCNRTTTCIVSGLAVGITHRFTVSARNVWGTGPASPASDPVLSAWTPAPPSGVATDLVRSVDDPSVTVSWNAESLLLPTAQRGSGSPITSYTASVVGDPALACATSGTSCTIGGLTNGASYRFQVSATNAIGEGAPSAASASVVPAFVPGAPTEIHASPSDGRVTIAWASPSPNGSTLLRYEVVDVDNPSTRCTYVVPAEETPTNMCIVTGLANGSIHRFAVTAVNGVGSGPTSVSSDAVVPLTTASVPRNVVAVAGDGRVEVSWDNPASDGGSRIIRYEVATDQLPGATCTREVVGSETGGSCAVASLENSVAYSFIVRAVNGAGSGPASSSTAPVTPSGVPGASVVTVAAGDMSAVVSWTPAPPNGSAVTSYLVTAADDDSKRCEVPVSGSSVNSCAVTGLTNGQTYTFVVRATNGRGLGAVSAPSPGSVPAGLPGVPTVLSVVPGDHQATIEWQASNANGADILDYTASVVGVASATCNVTADSGSTMRCTIGGLLNGTAYRFVVAARNALGRGSASDPGVAVTPSGVPASPVLARATAGSASATISWSAPSENGSAVTSYTARVVGNRSKSCAWTVDASGSNSCVVTGLANGSTVTFEVVATNANGDSAAATTTAVKPTGRPGTATGVSAIAGRGQATVSWTPVDETTTALRSYLVSAVESPLRTCTYRVGISTGNSCIVTGLANGGSYSFVVAAVNDTESGPSSIPSNSVVPRAPPAAPTGVVAVRNGNDYTLRWEAPFANGSAITSYKVKAVADASKTCTVTVPATRTCTITGFPMATQFFTVTATNAIGTSEASAYSSAGAFVPSAPGSVTAIASDGRATVSWAGSLANGSRITSYAVRSVANAGLGCSLTIGADWSGSAYSCIVTGLTNGVAYTFTATATNGVGTSVASTASASATPIARAGSPTAVGAVGADGSAVVAWTAPASVSPITSYTVTEIIEPPFDAWWWYRVPHTCTTTSVGGATPAPSCTVTGLTNGQSYRFTVAAVNAGGTGPASAVSSAVLVAAAPGVPSITAVSFDRYTGSALVDFTIPSSNGSAITSFTVKSVQDPSKTCTVSVASSLVTRCMVAGVPIGTSTTFTATATNSIGTSGVSAPSAALVPTQVPGAATSVVATPGDRNIVVTWAAAVANGTPVTAYTATATLPGVTYPASSRTPWQGQCVTSGSANTCTIGSLENGRNYDISVVATNAVGQGAAVSASAMPNSVPGAVARSVVGGNSSITVQWSDAVPNGRPIASYTATAVGDVTKTCTYAVGSSAVANETNRCTITGLANGTAYSVAVVATNANGSGPSGTPTSVTPATIPSAPTAALAVAKSESTVNVTWTLPSGNGGARISSYKVEAIRTSDLNSSGERRDATPVGSTCTTLVPVGSSVVNSCLVRSLVAGQSYVFTVTATNSAGTSAWSAVSAPVTPSTLPSAPELVVYPQAGGSVRLWMGYNNPAQGTIAKTAVLLGGLQSCTVGYGDCFITGLPIGVPLTFRATATNAIGSTAAPDVTVTLAAPPVAPASATALIGSSSATVVFSTPSEDTTDLIASVVGDPTKSCIVASSGRSCEITGLTSPSSSTFQVVARNADTGSGPARVATNYSGPTSVAVSGMTTSASAATTATASVSSSPVLRGTAVSPLVVGTASTVSLEMRPSGVQGWMDNVSETGGRRYVMSSASPVSHRFTATVSGDGSWSQALPADFPDGTFTVSVSQSTGWGTIDNTASPTTVVLSTPTTMDSVVLHGTGATALVTVSGSIPAGRTVSAITVSLPGSTVTPCTAVVSGSTWTCTLAGVTPSGTTRLEVSTTTQIWSQWCRLYAGSCVWSDLRDSLHTQTVVVSVIRDLATVTASASITSPTAAVLGANGTPNASTMWLLSGFGIAGTTTSPAASSVVLSAYRGVGVSGAPSTVATTPATGGSFATTLALADGVWTIDAAVVGTSGASRAGVPVTVYVKSTAPTVTIGWPQAAATIPSGFVGGTITDGWGTGSATPDITPTAVIDYFAGGSATGTARFSRTVTSCADCAGQFADSPTLANGVWTARVTAAARTGLTTVRTVTFTVDPAAAGSQSAGLTLLDADGAVLTNSSHPIAGTSFISVRVGSTTGRYNGPTATGSVTLFNGAVALGTSALVGGVAEFQTELPLGAAAHQLTARYTGNSWYLPTTSSAVALTLTPARPTAAVAPVFPNGLGQPGTLQVTLSYLGQRGTTQYCDFPEVRIQANTKNESSGGSWGGDGKWYPRPVLQSYSGMGSGFGTIATGRLVGPTTGGRPSGSGSIAVSDASKFDRYLTEFAFWISSTGDSRCGAFDGSRYDTQMFNTPETTPLLALGSIPLTQYVARATPIAAVARDATVGATSTYSVGQANSVAVDVRNAFADAVDKTPRYLADFAKVGRNAAIMGISTVQTLSVGVPVRELDAAGNAVGSPVLTDATGLARVSWTPTSAGWITKKFRVGDQATGGVFTGTVVSITVPVEAAPVNMVATQSVSPFVIGAAVDSTVSLGSAGLSGTIAYRDHALAGGPDAGVWQAATLVCSPICRSTSALPMSLRRGPSAIIDHRFVSAATGISYVSTTPVVRMASQPLGVTVAHIPNVDDLAAGLSAGSAKRDRLADIRVTLTNTVPDQWFGVGDDRRTAGSVLVTATPDCTGDAYCSEKVTQVRYDLAITGGAPVVVRSAGDSWVPTPTASVAVSGTNWTMTLDTEVFVGGMRFNVTAAYTPPPSAFYAVASSSGSTAVIGMGPAPIILSMGSATMTGGRCEPKIVTSASQVGVCTASNITPMAPIASAASPRPGQTVFVKAECDRVLCTPADTQKRYDLAIAQYGYNPKFISDPMDQDPTSAIATLSAGGVPSDTARPSLLSEPIVTSPAYRSVNGGRTYEFGRVGSARGVSNPFTCDRCMIWPISSLSPDVGSGFVTLDPGVSTLGLIEYSASATGTYAAGGTAELAVRTNRIVSFPLEVLPEPTQVSTRASFQMIRDSANPRATIQRYSVLTAARWPDLAPNVPVSASAVSVDVYMTNAAGIETEIAFCYYDGFCAPTRMLDGTALPTVKASMMKGQLSLEIDVPTGSWTYDGAGTTIRVETSSPWGTDNIGDPIPVSVSRMADSSGPALSVSVDGEWQGAVLSTPDLSSPSALGWTFYHETKSFFMYMFGEDTAELLTKITEQLIFFVVEAAVSAVVMNAFGIAALSARLGVAIYKIVKTVKAVKAMLTAVKAFNAARQGSKLWRASVAVTRFATDKLVGHYTDYLKTMPLNYFTSVIDSGGFGTPTFDDFFRNSTPAQLAAEQTNTDLSVETSLNAHRYKDYFDNLNTLRMNKASAAEPAKNDVGFGYGRSTQINQFFTTTIAISGANNGGFVDVWLMSGAHDPRIAGVVGDYRRLDGGRLAHCNLDGSCELNESVTATMANGRLTLTGNFPQEVSWVPPGAWLQATVTLAGGATAVGYYDIRFPGEQLSCRRQNTSAEIEACRDYQDAMEYGAKLTWWETVVAPNRNDPVGVGGRLPWVSVNPPVIDPKAGLPDQGYMGDLLPF